MKEDRDMEELKDEIEKMRGQLNKIVLGDVERDEVVKISQELDDLITAYYNAIGA